MCPAGKHRSELIGVCVSMPVQTAEIIAACLEPPPRIVRAAGLRERHLGSLEGRTLADIAAARDGALSALRNIDRAFAGSGAECLEEAPEGGEAFQERARAALLEISRERRGAEPFPPGCVAACA
jgi:broad specificity phosphatase PhoE